MEMAKCCKQFMSLINSMNNVQQKFMFALKYQWSLLKLHVLLRSCSHWMWNNIQCLEQSHFSYCHKKKTLFYACSCQLSSIYHPKLDVYLQEPLLDNGIHILLILWLPFSLHWKTCSGGEQIDSLIIRLC